MRRRQNLNHPSAAQRSALLPPICFKICHNIAITYYGSLVSFTGSSHGRAHLTSSAIISICVYYVLPPSACSVAKSVKLIICEALGACPCACLLPSLFSLCLSAGGARSYLAPCALWGRPHGRPWFSVSTTPHNQSLSLQAIRNSFPFYHSYYCHQKPSSLSSFPSSPARALLQK